MGQSNPRIRIQEKDYEQVSCRHMLIPEAWKLLLESPLELYSGWLVEGVLLEPDTVETYKTRVKLCLHRVHLRRWVLFLTTQAFGVLPQKEYYFVKCLTTNKVPFLRPKEQIVLKLQLMSVLDWDEIVLESSKEQNPSLFQLDLPEQDTRRIRLNVKGADQSLSLLVLVQRHYLVQQAGS